LLGNGTRYFCPEEFSVVTFYCLAKDNEWFEKIAVIKLGHACEFSYVTCGPTRSEKQTNTTSPPPTLPTLLYNIPLIGFLQFFIRQGTDYKYIKCRPVKK
jgi:hypothetical protein